MARAGFYAISSSHIRFGRDGRWYSDGEPIDNRRIANLFSRHIARHPEGGYQLTLGDEHARIEVDDTPYVVVTVNDDTEGLTITLNDGSQEALDPVSLRIAAGEVLYCDVKGGTERARFLRPAYYQLARFIEEEPPGRFYLRCRDTRHPIARA